MRTFSDSDLWYTPQEILAKLLADQPEFEHGYRDPATDAGAVATLPLLLRPKYANVSWDIYDVPYDPGLPIFINPPFSRKAGGTGRYLEWVYRAGLTPAAMLTLASTGSRWWQEAVRHSNAVLFFSPRPRFDRIEDGVRVTHDSPRQDYTMFFRNMDPHPTWSQYGAVLSTKVIR